MDRDQSGVRARETALNEPIDVSSASLDAILELRDAYRREMNCQVVHDSWHARGFLNAFVCRVDGQVVGHGSVGGAPGEARDVVKEFYVRAEYRAHASALMRQLVEAGSARWIEAQTNDALLTQMLGEFCVDPTSDVILFADGATTTLAPPAGVTLRPVTDADRARMFPHTTEPVGEWGIEHGGEVVATGGLLFHYNPPFGDIYMEVAGSFQRRGIGSYVVQELKRIAYDMDRTPAARCREANVASRRTLERAGMFTCGRIVRGRIA